MYEIIQQPFGAYCQQAQGGIDSVLYRSAHGGSFNLWQHVAGHLLVNGIGYSLFLWGVGALVYYAANMSRKKTMA